MKLPVKFLLPLQVILFLNPFVFSQMTELYTIIQYPVVPQKYCDLEANVSESSGLLYNEDEIWTMNDSGGLPEIYRIEKETGGIAQTVRIENGNNVDWEDLTQDEKHVYVGDFGNNHGNRKDLRIYKISKKDISGKKKIDVQAEVIGFGYKDQNDFSENSRNNDFDCEAMISYGDSLVLFSKNWVNGKCRLYKVPKVPGQYDPEPLDTFDTDGLITGASFFESTKCLILIGYKNHIPFIFYFPGFNGRNFPKTDVSRFEFVRMAGAQTEGIAWLNKDAVIFSTEQTKEFAQQVWELNLQTVFRLIEGR